jgi:hypothetical protein
MLARAFRWSLSPVRSIQFILLHPVSPRFILILSTYLHLDLPSAFSFWDPPPPLIVYIYSTLPHSRYMTCPSHPLLLVVIIVLGTCTSNEAPHCEAFLNLLSLHLSAFQIFSLTPCSQTPPVHEECQHLDVTPCGSCKNYVSEECNTSIIRVERISELGTT